MTITVIIATCGRQQHLRNVLSALPRQECPPDQTVVVMAPGSEDSEAILREQDYTITRTACTQRNVSVARNAGIREATGELVAFIDDDALPADKHWITRACDFFEQDAGHEFGAIGGCVMLGDSDQYEFFRDNSTVNDYGQIPVLGLNMKDPRISNRWITRVPGSNAVFRRAVLHQVGGFDEHYTYYHDETDLSYRIHRAGLKIGLQNDLIVRHYDAKVKNAFLYRRPWYAIARSDMYFAMKNSLDPLSARIPYAIRSIPLRHYWREVNLTLQEGNCTASESSAVKRQITCGWMAGFAKGLTQSRKLAQFS